MYIPSPLSPIMTHSKLPRLGGAGLRSTLTSPKVWRKSSARAKALRLNTCQDLLKVKKFTNINKIRTNTSGSGYILKQANFIS